MLLQTSLFEVERTVERTDEDEFSCCCWLKQDIRDNGWDVVAAGVADGDDRVDAAAAADVELAKLPIKSSLRQPA